MIGKSKDYVLQLAPSSFEQVIKVIGVGGGGSNAVHHMIESGYDEVGYVVCNTDSQALERINPKAKKVQLGIQLTKGLGAGTNPEIGQQAAIESDAAIRELLGGKTEMVFITAGMGGGTGTGAAPVIAKIAKELGLLVVAVVSDPFSHEGKSKIKQAREGIERLREYADTVLVIKNELLRQLYKDLGINTAYKKADEVLANGVKSIADLITSPGVINCDFADVKMVLANAGRAMMGSAIAAGHDRATVAIKKSLESPLLENNNIKGSQRILLSIAYSDELPEYEITMDDQGLITDFIESEIEGEAEIFKHGFAIDRSLKDNVRVTVVAAGFTDEVQNTLISKGKTSKVPSQNSEEPVEEVQQAKPATPKTIQVDNQTLIDYYLRNDYKKQSISEVPAFERFGQKPVTCKDLDNNKVSKYPLHKLFDSLKQAGMIAG